VESIITKFAKYLVRGKSYDAFHGVLLASYLTFIIIISGCSWCADKRVVVKPEPVNNRDRWKVLAPFIKQHFITDMTVEEIAAELAYQEYLLNKKDEQKVVKAD